MSDASRRKETAWASTAPAIERINVALKWGYRIKFHSKQEEKALRKALSRFDPGQRARIRLVHIPI